MDTQKVATEYRMSQWAQVIRERQQSNQTIKEFCELRGISRHAFFYWQRKLRQAVCTKLSKLEKPADSTPEGWMQLSTSQQMEEVLDIEVGGCHVSVNAGTDPELLKRVCRILRAL